MRGSEFLHNKNPIRAREERELMQCGKGVREERIQYFT